MNDACILAVDDEPLNLEILLEMLASSGYEIDTALDGTEAWNLLQAAPQKYAAILLDRMMPGMTGMEVLAKLKSDPAFATIPVILQTARAAKSDVIEGLKAGAHYYLCKPYDEQTLLAVVSTAVQDYRRYCSARADAAATTSTLKLLRQGTFKFRTLAEARTLSAMLANMGTSPDLLAIGLLELFVNAVEHGNLGISYQDKSKLNEEGVWQQEVERRLELVDYRQKFVTVTVHGSEHELQFHISDEGQGFDWEEYLQLSPTRAFDTHGRGISMARQLSFKSVEYRGRGNEVVAIASRETPPAR